MPPPALLPEGSPVSGPYKASLLQGVFPEPPALLLVPQASLCYSHVQAVGSLAGALWEQSRALPGGEGPPKMGSCLGAGDQGRAMGQVTCPHPRDFPGCGPSPTQNPSTMLGLPQGGLSCRKWGFSHLPKRALDCCFPGSTAPLSPEFSPWPGLWVEGTGQTREGPAS